MHSNEKPQPGTAGASAGEFPAGGGVTSSILAHPGRTVNPADPEAIHRDLAVFHRERAARWLAHAHLSAWHASKWRLHVDAAAEHDRLADEHARRRRETLDGRRHES